MANRSFPPHFSDPLAPPFRKQRLFLVGVRRLANSINKESKGQGESSSTFITRCSASASQHRGAPCVRLVCAPTDARERRGRPLMVEEMAPCGDEYDRWPYVP